MGNHTMPPDVPRLIGWALVRRSLLLFLGLLVGTLALLGACHTVAARPATAPAAAESAELRTVLPELAKAHADKIRLAAYATSFLRRLDPPVKDFAREMGAEHRRLQTDLQTWARARGYDLAFRYAGDVMGQARGLQEKEQGGQLMAEGGSDFQRDMLVLMYHDYDWQINLLGALLPTVNDPELKAYLEDSRRVHEAGFKRIRELLGKYRWGG